ncbi:hypothetical protein PspS35_26750 [Pseudomonas sp. S35]|uniref:hypothetical protein n=1 Tax=Pseudomonas sp. S35 TaxID=1573719 RepID=UPI00132F4824|nr:hypothetical protein [Pseudomonas sp. S35]QHF47212.1 hypothetical protein PspS35_26750 [Pseudomonas sp. S35]
MSNQLKRTKREKLKKKKNNINRSHLKTEVHHESTITPDHHAISLFLKIPCHITKITDICRFIGSNLKQKSQINEKDSIMQTMALTALYLLTKETNFTSEILESDFRAILKSISKIETIVSAATEGLADPQPGST